MARTKGTQKTAAQQIATNAAACEKLLAKAAALLDQRIADSKAGGHWGNAGDLGHYAEQLAQLVRTLDPVDHNDDYGHELLIETGVRIRN